MAHVKAIKFPVHEDVNGTLCVYEGGKHVSFKIQRVFTASAKAGDFRGDHAHKECTQLLICVSGEIRVYCDDGATKSQHLLENAGTGLLIPPRTWAKEEYLSNNAVLLVLCDKVYEESDYIRDYGEFKKYRTRE